MKRWYLVILCAIAGVSAVACLLLSPEGVTIEGAHSVQRPPRIFPDYAGCMIPPNIAPLNFTVLEPGSRYYVRIRSDRGTAIEVVAATGAIVIPFTPWRALLQDNRGTKIHFDIYVERAHEAWQHYDTITATIANEATDRYLVYRLLKPLYSRYGNLGIYQRNLENYDESRVLHNRTFNHGCLNCHTFLNNSPKTMAVHIRTATHGKPMLVVRNEEIATVMKPGGYMTWHPSGRLIAFSINRPSLFFHTVGETRDVFDASSDILVYMVDTNRRVAPSGTAQPERLETWPAWAPDGRHLYFCSAPKLAQHHFKDVKYSLIRVPYDLESDTWGAPEEVLAARDAGGSITQPRISPDGRYLLFCMSEYGNFPVYLKSSDLYLMDLETRNVRRLAINSDQPDSWHSWSSNSRWIVFSSKRRDGLFAKPYLSYVDTEGTVYKPVLVPHEDPRFYDSFIQTYNVPELITDPIQVTERDLSRAILNPRTPLTPKADTPEEEHRDAVYPSRF